MDITLISIGTILLLFGGVMLLVYLVRPGRSLFDPIAMSWLGYILFIAYGMFGTGLMGTNRLTAAGAEEAIVIVLTGTLGYTAGLYLSRGKLLSRAMPVPRAELTRGQVWLAVIVGGGLLATTTTIFGVVPPQGALSVFRGLNFGAIGMLGLLGVYALVKFKGAWLTKILALGSCAFGLVIYYQNFWSRRPLLGLALALGGLYYREKWRHKGRAFKLVMFLAVVVGIGTLHIFLTTTRRGRFYGAEVTPTFSVEALEDMSHDFTICYQVLEWSAQHYPSSFDYMYGRGLALLLVYPIPRAIWDGKPLGTSMLITERWTGTGGTVGLTVPGEWYVNFGFFGPFIGLFLWGVAVRGLNRYLTTHEGNSVLWGAWFLALPDYVTIWRGDSVTMIWSALLRVILFLGLAWLASKLAPTRRAPAFVSTRPDLQSAHRTMSTFARRNRRIQACEDPVSRPAPVRGNCPSEGRHR